MSKINDKENIRDIEETLISGERYKEVQRLLSMITGLIRVVFGKY
jgi:hypothetical protein